MVASNSFSLNGVIESGKEPITIRFVGFPEVLPVFVATTLFALLSALDDFRSGEPFRECWNNKNKLPSICVLHETFLHFK